MLRLLFLLLPLLAIACAASEEPFAKAPPCATPAPLSLAKEGAIADTWIVMLDDDVADVRAETDALAARHAFVVGARLDIIRGFVARTDSEKIARVRCENSVKTITQDRRAKALTAETD